MSNIEDKYKQALNTDLAGLTKNTARKFSFLLKSLGAEYVHGKLYDLVLDDSPFVYDEAITSKFFATPMWDRLVLDTENSNKKNIKIDMVLMTVSMSKHIIKTAIQGMSGTVKEYISDGDFVINIKGGIFGENNEYPEDDVLDLLEVLKQPNSIMLESKFLEHFDINTIVVENYRLEAKEGQGNTQLFEINAISDMPKELIFSANTENNPITE